MVNARPTIVQVLHTLRVGGAEILAANLARRLQHRYRFVFACLEEVGTIGHQLINEGFQVEVLGRKPGLDWGCAFRLGRLCRRERAKLIHAHQWTPFFYASIARWFYRPPAIVFTEHGRFYPDYRRPKRVFANRFLLEPQDRVTGVGEFVKQALVQNEGIPAARIETIYNGIDVEQFRPAPERRAVVRAELGLANDDFAIFQVARLDPIKDHATAVRTMARVAAQRPNAKLLIVGEGPEQATIETLIRQHNLAANVRMFGLRTDVPRLLAAADCFLLTSKSEGIPLTVIEAMAAGLPVVATDVGGMAEVVIHDHTGFLASANDDGGLSDCVMALERDHALRDRIGQTACRRAAQSFSDREMVHAYDGLFHASILN